MGQEAVPQSSYGTRGCPFGATAGFVNSRRGQGAVPSKTQALRANVFPRNKRALPFFRWGWGVCTNFQIFKFSKIFRLAVLRTSSYYCQMKSQVVDRESFSTKPEWIVPAVSAARSGLLPREGLFASDLAECYRREGGTLGHQMAYRPFCSFSLDRLDTPLHLFPRGASLHFFGGCFFVRRIQKNRIIRAGYSGLPL